MEDKRRYYTPTDGEVSLSQIYKWIRKTAKHVDALFFDPVFDMLEVGMSVEIHWVKEDMQYMKTVTRTV
jgi:hypothetical protein